MSKYPIPSDSKSCETINYCDNTYHFMSHFLLWFFFFCSNIPLLPVHLRLAFL